MKIIHLSDIHYSRENQERALASLKTVCETGEKEGVDLYVIAGDLFDRPVNNTSSSGFPDLIGVIQRMMNKAPVVAVKGTPTHDTEGCYKPFTKIEARYPFIILDPAKPYFLENFGIKEERNEHTRLLILGCGEPQKTWFLKDRQLGKEESNEAIKGGMKELFIGVDAIRKDNPDIPCLFVYHGTVAGASISENQVMPPGGIQVGREDLAMIGADYYALGHIHLGQSIPDIPAEYCGSAFPVDWGEIDQKCFNLVEIEGELVDNKGYAVSLTRIPYPHPPRTKIVTTPDDGTLSGHEIKGFQVWEVIRGTKEEVSKLTVEAELETLLFNGALPGSRVDISIIPTETVRSEQITEASRLSDKVKIYAELSGDSVSDSILKKADELMERARSEGATAEGLYIRICKLVLRGAVGIKKGIGKDEVEIDLDQYDPGLIALVGVNGSGKTTLIENMHPYPQMLTRTGKLQDHFCLRDSFRDLYYTDTRTGTEYRAFMQIDGVNKSGAVEYFLYKRENGTWQPLSDEINGRREGYTGEIERLFGSLPLFLRSAFVSQKQPKNLPDLADATKGEKKALFRELGGLDYLQVYADYSKDRAKVLNDELTADNAKIETLEDFIKQLPENEERFKNLRSELNMMELELEDVEEQKARLQEELEEVAKLVDKNTELRRQMNEYFTQTEDLRHEKTVLETKIEEYEKAVEKKKELEESLDELGALIRKENELNEQRTNILKERERILSEYNNQKEAVANTLAEIQAGKTEAEKSLQAVQHKKDNLQTEANLLDREIAENPLTENCPTCGQAWPEDRRAEFETKQVEKMDRLKDLMNQIFDLDKEAAVHRRDVRELQEELETVHLPDPPFLPEINEQELITVQNQIRAMNEPWIRGSLDKAKEAAVRIEEYQSRIEGVELQLAELLKKADDLKEQLDPVCEAEFREKKDALDEKVELYNETDRDCVRIRTEIENVQKIIQQLKIRMDELVNLKDQVGTKLADVSEWEYLQRACGPDGIQALELDAMGPGIADVANSILESAYGSRFQIEFRTTRIGGKGSQTKQIEDFQIIIHDSQDGSEQLLETLSGGESVWVKRAIYDAFGIIRARKTGTKFLTVFQDEADGALDPEARGHYFRMLERAHQEAGRYHTLIITHSEKAQETIGQKVEMSELQEAVKEGALA
jgi:exonuclease SbcC